MQTNIQFYKFAERITITLKPFKILMAFSSPDILNYQKTILYKCTSSIPILRNCRRANTKPSLKQNEQTKVG